MKPTILCTIAVLLPCAAWAAPNDGTTGPLRPDHPKTELMEQPRQPPETTGRASPDNPHQHRGWQPQPDLPLPSPPPDRARE